MGIDSMRVGGGRCPPLLVGGLLIACLMLICNWWTSSSENLELLRQIDDFSEQLKISAEERDQCVTLRGKLEQRYKDSENEVASLHDQLEQQPKFKKRNEILEEANKMCKTELDSLNKLDAARTATLDTLRSEKNSINSQLDEEKEENRKLSEKLMEVQDELHRLKSAQNSPADQESKLAETGTSNSVPPIIPTEQGVDNRHGNDDDNHIEESNIEDELENAEDDTNLGNVNNEVAKEKSEKLNGAEK